MTVVELIPFRVQSDALYTCRRILGVESESKLIVIAPWADYRRPFGSKENGTTQLH